jgi:hypothetical protein
MNKVTFVLFLSIFFSVKATAQKTAYTLPEANKILKAIHLYVDVELNDSIKTSTGLTNSHYLLPLINHIDYNIIGKGNIAIIEDVKLREFIIKSANEGKKAAVIEKELITEYIRLEKKAGTSIEKEDVFHVGGYLATEMEYHQEPDGDYITKD